jgi:hypothetical protein
MKQANFEVRFVLSAFSKVGVDATFLIVRQEKVDWLFKVLCLLGQAIVSARSYKSLIGF